MKIEKLLFVTKFEELGFDAVRSLLSLTMADLNHVVFINVIEREKFSMSRVGYRKDEEIRLREAAKHGFRRAIVPRANRPKQAIEGMEIVPVTRGDGTLHGDLVGPICESGDFIAGDRELPACGPGDDSPLE